jgi:acyl-CoA thioesterase I
MRPLYRLIAATGFLLCASAVQAEPIRIVAFGDSNTAGFGVSDHNSYPSQLERALKAMGYDVEVSNEGVSGNTSGMALDRFDSAFEGQVDIAIIFLGRNDMRFGVDISRTRRNLDTMVRKLRERNVEVILAGFYSRDFSDIAAAHNITYYPDFFEGVAIEGVKQPKYVLFWDIIRHLNADGYKEVVTRLSPVVELQVQRVFCMRLGDAAMFYPPCKELERMVQVTGSIQRR